MPEVSVKFIKTGFPKLDELLHGGLILNTFTGIMGKPGEGKSIFLTDLAVRTAKELKGNILIINTEEAEGVTNALWFEKLAAIQEYKGKMFVEYAPDFESLLQLHGVTAVLASSKAGPKKSDDEEAANKKVKLAKKELVTGDNDVFNSIVYDYIKNKNVKVIIYDSLSTPFDLLAAGGQQNRPLRSTGQELFWQATRTLTINQNILLLSSHHVSFDPAAMFPSREDNVMKGGIIVHHMHKIVFYIEQFSSKYALEYRRLFIVRHPQLREWSHHLVFKLDENGYHEATEEEAAAASARAKKEAKAERDAKYGPKKLEGEQ